MRNLRHATNASRSARLACGAVLTALLAAGSAAAKPALIITGAGLGHGIGMSQYGADGFAQHGFDYATILGHYYEATTLSTLPSSPTVRVLLASGGTQRFSGATRAGGHTLSPARHYTVSASGGSVVLVSSTGRTVGTFSPTLKVSGTGPLTLYGSADNGIRSGRYRGALEFRAVGGGVQAVNALNVESYVRGVVAAESPSSWPAAALEAQAVAARTYAITAKVGGTGYTQYSDTRSQEYQGVSAETAATDAAVRVTAGQVVTYLGKPVATYFFSSSGGQTEDIQNVFLGTTPDPWLTAVPDPYDTVSPDHRWGPIDLSLGQVDSRLSGLIKGSFRGIRVTQRGASPRIVDAQVLGTGGTTDVTGPQLQQRFGLDDTWAYFSTSGTAVKVPTTPGATSGAGAPTNPTTGGSSPTPSGVPTTPATTPAAPTTTPASPTGGASGP
jgi:stage II sporulation protein D